MDVREMVNQMRSGARTEISRYEHCAADGETLPRVGTSQWGVGGRDAQRGKVAELLRKDAGAGCTAERLDGRALSFFVQELVAAEVRSRHLLRPRERGSRPYSGVYRFVRS